MPESPKPISTSWITEIPYRLGVVLSYIVVAAFYVFSIFNEFRHIDQGVESLARERGTVLFKLIELTRYCNEQHGGI